MEFRDESRFVIGPCLDENPMTELEMDQVEGLDCVFCTYGHSDPFADAIPLAKRAGTTPVSTFELVTFVRSRGVENAHPTHVGGESLLPSGRVKMTPARGPGSGSGRLAGALS